MRRRGKILRSAVTLLKPVIQRLDVPISARLQWCRAWVLLHKLLRCAFPTLQLLGPYWRQLLRVTLRIDFLPLRLDLLTQR